MQKFRKLLPLFFLFSILILPGIHLKASAASPPICGIDKLNTSPYITSTTRITGWALNSSGVAAVQISIDGRILGRATFDALPRTDKSNPRYSTPAAGFHYSIGQAANTLSAGTHQLRVTAIGKNGSTSYTDTTVQTAQPACTMDPLNTAPYLNAATRITGSVSNAAGVAGVAILLDGSRVGWATVLSGSAAGQSSSVYSYSIGLSIGGISTGSHTIQAVAYCTDGRTVRTQQVNVSKSVASSGLDAVNTAPNLNTTTKITGWAYNDSGVAGVQVYLDNVSLGQAAMDSTLRTDKKSPQFGNCAAGFSFTMGSSAQSLKPGGHTVKVVVTGKDGAVTNNSVTLTVPEPPQKSGVDAVNTAPYLTSSTKITGWALNDSGISNVQISLDGTVIGTATIDAQPRSDIDSSLYNTAAFGFSFTVGTSVQKLSSGSHTLQVIVNGKNGERTVNSITFTVPSPTGAIESVSTGSSLLPSTVISGWALNDSGYSSVHVLVDGVDIGTATTTSRPDKNDSRFITGAIGYSFTFGSAYSSLSAGTHTVSIVTYGTDGTTTVSTCTLNVASTTTTTSYPITLANLAQKNNVSASSIDPGTLSQNAVDKYQFMRLTWVEGITADEIDAILNADHQKQVSLGNNTPDVLLGSGSAIIAACKQYNVNPLYFVCHMILETGHGTSTLASGVLINGVKYYNVLGIHAYDSDPIGAGSQYAQSQGWDSVAKAISGAVQWVAKNYINASSYYSTGYNQNTLYEMKWDPYGWAYKGSSFEYATDPNWAHLIANLMYQYSYVLSDSAPIYDIPVFQ